MDADSLSRDLRLGVRALRRERAASCFIILIAALGIAASATVFGICRALVLRPLPFADPERLVWVANGTNENLSAQTVQVNNLLALRDGSRVWEDVAGFSPFYASGDVRMTGPGEPERITAVPVTQTFFSLLGVRPLVGRWFDDEESRWQAPKRVVLSHDFWRRRFDGDRDIVGRAIVLDGEPVTVVGVLPEAFDFAATFTPGRPADVFVPFSLGSETNRQGNTLALVGRLRAGATIASAQSEASRIGERVVGARDGERQRNGLEPRLSPLREHVSGRYDAALVVLAAAVGFLMLLVCANVANLLLVRSSSRRREMAVRAALGAPRRRLVQQVLAEGMVLCAAGASLGIALAYAGTFAVRRIQGTTIPLLGEVHVDGTVLVFAVVLSMVTGLGFALLPALQGSAQAPAGVLSDGARGSTDAHGGRLRRAIVVAEVAAVCVLLTGAGLLLRSLDRVLRVRPGFSTTNVLAVRVDPGRTRAADARNSYFDAIVREVSGVPGVESLGLTDALPLGDNFGWRRWDASRPERARGEAAAIFPLVRMADEGYLAALGIPLRAGRAFTRSDDASQERVIILNERLARTFFPEQDAVGRLVHVSGEIRRVVGVVGDVHYFGLDRDTDAEMYMPLRTGDYQSVDLVVRSSAPTAALVAGIRAALRRVDATLPLAGVRTMEQLVDRSLFARRFLVWLVAGFAAFGLLLASLGLYAVISYTVAQRTQEMGIRMALGATPARLLAGVLGQTGRLAMLGVAAGLPLSWAAARAIRSQLYDVPPSDPATFAAVLVVLAVVAALAGLLPARRATRVDPAVALRAR